MNAPRGFCEATATSAGMVTKTPGVGSVYLGCYKDSDDDWLDGANTYRLHVPPNAPAKQFWSLTLYDVDTRALIQNTDQIADRSSRQELVKSADGSVDLYVGPKAPTGFERNWIPHRRWQSLVSLLPPLRADRTALQPGMDSAGFRESKITVAELHYRRRVRPQRRLDPERLVGKPETTPMVGEKS